MKHCGRGQSPLAPFRLIIEDENFLQVRVYRQFKNKIIFTHSNYRVLRDQRCTNYYPIDWKSISINYYRCVSVQFR